ncbi:hypothetical protein LCGC14_1910760 [marine sediment metagenome]|uniref:Sulfotransferase domain-containing protein n=1 Tax=marine sediment metagenome TaxID=412755 RepID=A0A0F9GH21_9ZZZZ
MGEAAGAAEISHAGDILLKPIFLQTTPHTGTNSAFYLFHMLGGIPVFFIHFGDWEMSEFLEKIEGHRDDFVWLHTFRTFEAILATYKKRTPEYAHDPDHANSAENLVKRNMVVEEKWKEAFSEAILLPIVGDIELQTFVAKQVFAACGVEVPVSAKRFLETWYPIGTFPTGDPADSRGWENMDLRQQQMKAMESARVLPKNRGEDLLNEYIEGLSK